MQRISPIYDPQAPAYVDEAEVRAELTRAFDLCDGCRACVSRCTSFPTLFDMIERRAGGSGDHDAGLLTPAQQDEVVGRCFQCGMCITECPYASDAHDRLDLPRLMLRAKAMQRHTGRVAGRESRATWVLGRADLVGTIGCRTAPLANRLIARPGSLVRKVLGRLVGVSPQRPLPEFTGQRFSRWFARRLTAPVANGRGTVTVVPTCLVEYQAPAIGQDLVKVYERNGLTCSLSTAGCCGAPSLFGGDVARFTRLARRNVSTLAVEVRRGTDLVVAHPTCATVVRDAYVDHVGGTDAELVAAHTYEAAEYLMRMHREPASSLDVEFDSASAAAVTYQAPDGAGERDGGLSGRDLLRLTGARVTVVRRSAGTGGMWGLRAGNEILAEQLLGALGAEIERAGGDALVGDCHLANTAISERTGREVRHPLQLVARAYGIAEEPESATSRTVS